MVSVGKKAPIENFVKAPVGKVFAYLADPANRPEWQSSLKRVEIIDSGEPQTGMRWIDVTAVPGVRPQMVITECTPYRVWSERGTWRGIAADLELRFTQTTQGTKVSATVDLQAKGWWRLPAAVAGRLAPAALRADMEKAAEIIAGK